MTYKRRILSTLTRADLLALGRTFERAEAAGREGGDERPGGAPVRGG